jgi:L-2-hydroxyglutarate oxidase
MTTETPIVIIGGGIVGLATARALTAERHLPVLVLEAEAEPGQHQTGHNSGVIHAGLYYTPGSLKARLCVAGRDSLYAFCAEHGIPHQRCGKLLVARSREELPALDRLAERGRSNGLEGLRRLDAEEIAEIEPHAVGTGALHVPETGVVDYGQVSRALVRVVRDAGGEIRTGCRVVRIRRDGGDLVLETSGGDFHARHVVNCAGLQSDRVARLCGVDPEVRIIPFRGEYLALSETAAALVRALVYPLPDPRFPFLGVHLTRRIDGRVEAGPNAVLALRREGYRRTSFSLTDTLSTLSYPGFWKLMRRHWRTGLSETGRTVSRSAFAAGVRELIPAVGDDDLRPAGCGVRAQAIDGEGRLIDDFHIVHSAGATHVVNAPSPAATASLAIGRHVADLVVNSMS